MPRYKDAHELAGEVGGMYALVVAVAKRAKQLREGRQAVVECGSSNPLTVAIRELVDGRVVMRPPGVVEEGPPPGTEIVEVAAPGLRDETTEQPAEAEDADDEAAEE